jgi:hypothetical protein
LLPRRQRLENLSGLLLGQRRPAKDIRQSGYIEARQVNRVIARLL